MIKPRVTGMQSAVKLLQDYVCSFHKWDKNDTKVEVITTNLKTGEKDYLVWPR